MQRLVTTVAVIVAVMATAATAMVAAAARRGPARCPVGTVERGPRCCAPGQSVVDNHCGGEPKRCPGGLVVQSAPRPGCVPVASRIRIPATVLTLGPSDWEAQGEVQPGVIEVSAFEIDSTEVTYARWTICAEGGVCEPLDSVEPGVPVTSVSAESAARFCRFVGGRLPRGDEWLVAAAGAEGRRYPWGPTGLVCRRAVFGLEAGPCAKGVAGPEVAGMRPDGRTPSGVLDLAGNVAEWTVEPNRRHVARGGSFRSRVAGDLKSWAVEQVAGPADHVGFRCVYGTVD